MSFMHNLLMTMHLLDLSFVAISPKMSIVSSFQLAARSLGLIIKHVVDDRRQFLVRLPVTGFTWYSHSYQRQALKQRDFPRLRGQRVGNLKIQNRKDASASFAPSQAVKLTKSLSLVESRWAELRSCHTVPVCWWFRGREQLPRSVRPAPGRWKAARYTKPRN